MMRTKSGFVSSSGRQPGRVGACGARGGAAQGARRTGGARIRARTHAHPPCRRTRGAPGARRRRGEECVLCARPLADPSLHVKGCRGMRGCRHVVQAPLCQAAPRAARHGRHLPSAPGERSAAVLPTESISRTELETLRNTTVGNTAGPAGSQAWRLPRRRARGGRSDGVCPAAVWQRGPHAGPVGQARVQGGLGARVWADHESRRPVELLVRGPVRAQQDGGVYRERCAPGKRPAPA